MANAIADKVQSAYDYLLSILDVLDVSINDAIEKVAYAPMGNVARIVVTEGKSLQSLVDARKTRRSKLALVAAYLMTLDLPQVTDAISGKVISKRVEVARRIAGVFVTAKKVDDLTDASVEAVMDGYNRIRQANEAIQTAVKAGMDSLGDSAKLDAAALGDIVTSLSRQFGNGANANAVQAVILPQLEALADLFGKKLV